MSRFGFSGHLAVAALLLVESLPARAQPLLVANDAPIDARRLVLAMAELLAGQPAWRVDLVGGYDVMQDDGRKIQFVESRSVALQRPDRLLISEELGDQRGQSLLFDGSSMTIWDARSGVYAQAGQPPTVDDGVLYFIRDLQMRLPLAPLFATWFPRELDKRILEADYVETTGVFGQPAHHVAVRTAGVDFQAWIAAGDQPLPLRLVITYDEPGHPQYWAQFSNWDLAPAFAPDTFRLVLPKGLRQIAFAVQVPPLPVAPGADSQPVERP